MLALWNEESGADNVVTVNATVVSQRLAYGNDSLMTVLCDASYQQYQPQCKVKISYSYSNILALGIIDLDNSKASLDDLNTGMSTSTMRWKCNARTYTYMAVFGGTMVIVSLIAVIFAWSGKICTSVRESKSARLFRLRRIGEYSQLEGGASASVPPSKGQSPMTTEDSTMLA